MEDQQVIANCQQNEMLKASHSYMNQMSYSPFLTITIFTIIFTTSSCEKNVDTVPSLQKNGVTIILNDPPSIHDYFSFPSGKKGSNGMPCIVGWVNDIGIMEYFCPKYTAKGDTLNIETVRSSVKLIHKIYGLDYFNYMIRNGDTLIINYNNKDSLPTVKPADVLDNYYYERLTRELQSPFDPIVYLHHDYTKRIYSSINEIRNNVNLHRLLQDYINIDSLFERLALFHLRELAELKDQNSDRTRTISEDIKKKFLLATYNYYQHGDLDSLDLNLIRSFDLFSPEDQLYYSNLFSLDRYNTEYNLPPIDPNTDLSKFKKRWDIESVMYEKEISEVKALLNDYLLTHKSSEDSSYINSLDQALGLSYSSDTLTLISADKSIWSLESIVQNHKKKWYINFWASWCAPCRKSMPDFIKLAQNSEEDNEYGFLLLALNDKYDDWVNASKQLNISSFQNSYLIRNALTSNFIKENKIESLPRYMVLDSALNVVIGTAKAPKEFILK